MSDANKSIVRQFLNEVINKDDSDARPDLIDPGVIAHFGGMPVLDLDGWRQMAGAFFVGLPDLTVTIEDEVAEGDRVAVRWTWTATHTGTFMDLPATGKAVVGSGMGVYRVSDGKVAEEWILEDMLGILQQLGAIPAS